MQKKRVLKQTKGFYGRSKNCNKLAKQALHRAWQNSYRDRKNKKRNMRSLWNIRINCALRNMSNDLTYSKFIGLLRKQNNGTIAINRKVMCQMPENVFQAYVNKVISS